LKHSCTNFFWSLRLEVSRIGGRAFSTLNSNLSITDYTAKLEELVDALRDLGQTMSEPSRDPD
jgi:hypothetical protein